MSNGSFYVRDNPAFKGGSPQAVYEELWERGRKQRKIVTAVVAFACFAIGLRVASPFTALGMGVAGAGGAWAGQWYRRAMHTVWLHGRRGDHRTAQVLRFLLERRGYRVLHGRQVPGQGTLDQLVIGPTGVWAINSHAWAPEAQFAMHNGKLFIGRDPGAPEIDALAVTADTVTDLVNDWLRRPLEAGEEEALVPNLTVQPLLVVYGGMMPRRKIVWNGVTLARSYQIRRRIRRGDGTAFTPEQVEAVVQAAVRALPIGDNTMAAR
jgi:hypothetical protein